MDVVAAVRYSALAVGVALLAAGVTGWVPVRARPGSAVADPPRAAMAADYAILVTLVAGVVVVLASLGVPPVKK